MESWLIYALGGGWGHLMRALALGRMSAGKRSLTILTNSPYAAPVQQEISDGESVTLIALDPQADRAEISNLVRTYLQTRPYSHLFIDTFPRGLGGELATLLPTLDCNKILIHRLLNPRYIAQGNLRSFVSRQFHRILIPGEVGPLPFESLPQARRTAPWLIRDPATLPDRSTSAPWLNLAWPHPQPIAIVLAAGRGEELNWYGQVTASLADHFPDLTVRCLAPTCPPHCPPHLWHWHFPALEILPLASVIIGGGGYHTVYESQALGIPLIARPFPRLYDRQDVRLQTLQTLESERIKIVHSLQDVMETLNQVHDHKRLTRFRC